MHNNLFVGISRNTGHRNCGNIWNGIDSYDLVLIGRCAGWSLPGNNNVAVIDLTDTRPRFTNEDDKFSFWYKPAGGVYRSFGSFINYPIQGIAIYDTWLLNTAFNNTFYDYYGSKG